MEITNLHANTKSNDIAESLALAFSQVAQKKESVSYLVRGETIAKKHRKVFTNYLEKSHLPTPRQLNDDITPSTIPPFSDKLMMFHMGLLVATLTGSYGLSMAGSPRHDITLDYGRLLIEIEKYGDDGVSIMIENNWMEKPPCAPNRMELRKNNQ